MRWFSHLSSGSMQRLCPSKSLPNVEPKPDEGPATRYQFYATAMILP